MIFLLAGFARQHLDGRLQILDAAGDVGIARGAAGLAVVLMVHGPAIEPVAGELVHHGIFALAGHVQVERPRADRRAVDEEYDRTRRLPRLRRAETLAIHPARNVAFLGPIFAAPYLAVISGLGAGWQHGR